MHDLARDHLEELMGFLSDDVELTPEETMNEVCLLVDNYRSELALEIDEEQKEANISLVEDEPQESLGEQEIVLQEAYKKLSSTNFNRGFLLGKATDIYYKKAGLDPDSFGELTPAEKVKHRKLITEIYNDLIIKEAQKPSKTVKNVFGGAIKRKQSEEDAFDEDLDAPADARSSAEIDFYKSQIKELKKTIRLNEAEIDQIQQQNKIDKVSSVIISRNLNRIEELKDDLEADKKELSFYQNKLK